MDVEYRLTVERPDPSPNNPMTHPDEATVLSAEIAGASGRWGVGGLILLAIQVRLRFVIVLAVAFVLVGRWDAVLEQGERLVRLVKGPMTTSSSVSSDTEYFCPMDPGVVSDWPAKCGICNMGLVRRKRGEAALLPSGVVARMQFSPYRIQLAGVNTSPVDYRPLTHETLLGGVVGDERSVVAEASPRELAWLSRGQAAEVECEALPGRTFVAKVRTIRAGGADLVHEDRTNSLQTGMRVSVRLRRPVAEIEPFRSQPSEPPPIRKDEPRNLYLCPTHAEVLRLAAGKCPVDGKETLHPDPLRDNQRIAWWCPMHPKIQADHDGESCAECGGMKLVPRRISYRPAGQVLTVPESALVDTGLRTVVYVETMPGMFDGVEISVGPRCGDTFPVIRGLEPGARVATAGTFLIDAETRLNPALASAYFGAGRKPDSAPAASETIGSTAIPAELRALASSQKICPVTRKPLGSMGAPLKVLVDGHAVLVCCEGCEGPLLKSPSKYLARIAEEKTAVPRP